jgi:hypothetical protein
VYCFDRKLLTKYSISNIWKPVKVVITLLFYFLYIPTPPTPPPPPKKKYTTTYPDIQNCTLFSSKSIQINYLSEQLLIIQKFFCGEPETVVAIRFFSAVLFQPRSNNMPLTEERPIDQQESEEISGVYQGMCSSNIEATKQMNALDPMDMHHAPTRPCRCPCP